MDVYLCYVGRGLGSAPMTMLQGGDRHVQWNRFDKRVRKLSGVDAAHVLQQHPGQFVRAMPLDALATALGIDVARLDKLGKAGAIHVEVYTPAQGDTLTVVVLDEWTDQGVAEAVAPAAAASSEPQPGHDAGGDPAPEPAAAALATPAEPAAAAETAPARGSRTSTARTRKEK